MKIQHVRIARATMRLAEIRNFYRDVLMLTVIAKFDDHDGFSGVMLGDSAENYHFEFTCETEGVRLPPPSEEQLGVLYLEDEAWNAYVARVRDHGIAVVRAHNDPDGYRIVLHRGAWCNP